VTRRPPIDPMDQRLADQVWAFYRGETTQVVLWLLRLGCEIPISRGTGDHCEYTIQGLTGIRVGIYYPGLDPVTLGVQFGFLLGGQMWASVYPRMLEAVNAKWKEERRGRESEADSDS
jgi:hypothetical protein